MNDQIGISIQDFSVGFWYELSKQAFSYWNQVQSLKHDDRMHFVMRHANRIDTSPLANWSTVYNFH